MNGSNQKTLEPGAPISVASGTVTLTNQTSQNGEVEVSESTLAFKETIPANSSKTINVMVGGATITNIGSVPLGVSY